MSSSESREELFLTPEPYLREVYLNYVKIQESYVVIPTGKWFKETGKERLILDRNRNTYQMSEVPLENVKERFISKYGKVHFGRYFSDAHAAFQLDPYGKNYDVSSGIEQYFDAIAEQYESEVTSSFVQSYMRKIAKTELERNCFQDSRVLDLGCGIMLESSGISGEVNLEGADISGKMLEIARSRLPESSRVKLIKTDTSLTGDYGSYDLIFTSYGLIELVSSPVLERFISEHLTAGGKFIGVFWNRTGILDLILSFITGKIGYMVQKLKRRISPGSSRYALFTRIKKISEIIPSDNYAVIKKIGICGVLPPFNYRFVERHPVLIQVLGKLDEKLNELPFISFLSDYVLVVANKR